LLVRYKKDHSGDLKRAAHIYTLAEHGIRREHIERRALSVIRRLQSHGYNAYLVGGAIRDLLLGQSPKDFDVATNATPNNIRKLFRNSRIIGRRFKLVHIHFDREIIEVSTFRAQSGGNNRYGTIEEDVKRRDFTINALYYCPEKQQIIDYVGGFEDIQKKRLRTVIPLDRIFAEDPVRMVRAVKYSAITGFSIPKAIRNKIKSHAHEIKRCSSSRITEEVFKILRSGYAGRIIEQLEKMNLLCLILPRIAAAVGGKEVTKEGESTKKRFFIDLAHIDSKILNNKKVKKGEMLQMLLQEPLLTQPLFDDIEEVDYHELFKEAKRLLKPITPPNLEVEWAVKRIMRHHIP
jgi:poly(A) polymerase